MGRLTPDKMGYNMPVIAPLYRPPQGIVHSFRNQEIAMVVYEADEKAVLDILPPGVEPTNSPPQLNAWIARAGLVTGGRDNPVGGYDELQIAIHVTYEGQRYVYIPYFYISPSPGSRSDILGYIRHVRGYPAKTAWITFEKDLGQYIGCVERPKRKRLATLTVQPEVSCAPEDIPMGKEPGLLMKLLPNTIEGEPPSVCELAQFSYNWAPKADLSYQGSGTLTFDSPTDIDPLYKLAPTRILSAWYFVVDADIPQGKVVKNYLEDWKKAPTKARKRSS